MQNHIADQNYSHTYRLPLADKNGIHYFLPKEIIRLEAMNVYTTLYFEGHPPFVVSKVLKTYEVLLEPFGFVRTHRSHMVNRQYVRCVTNNTIIMQDASVAELSRRNKKKVVQQLSSKARYCS